ncbi:hypothetical protein [Pseudomonas putida]|uniref:hypothetical protein n=1 Tax=Pseudomonas putida TaxID=303 RepID=UPI00128EC7F2|nr:hypothetical protein [Pseudomonas putida]
MRRKKTIAITLLIAIACCIGVITAVNYEFSRTRTIVFGKDPEPLILPYDISITSVSISVPGFKYGGFADYCLGTWRGEPDPYPIKKPILGRGGFIEPLCFNTVRTKAVPGWVYPTGPVDGPVFVPAGDWNQSVDLTKSPIYVPKDTLLTCNSLGTVSSVLPSGSMDGTCTIQYTRYQPNSPRYRFLRLPYYDQMFSADEPMAPSYFQSYAGGKPLNIVSAVAYIGNNLHTSAMDACLTHEKNGEVIERFCFPPSDQDSPGQVPVNWTIKDGERLSLECHYPPEDKVSSGDCAIYLVAELPEDLELSAENAFRDYGEVPRDYIPVWCEKTAKTLKTEVIHNPMLCLSKEGTVCSFEEKMSNCLESFDNRAHAKATCMADNSCYDSYAITRFLRALLPW